MKIILGLSITMVSFFYGSSAISQSTPTLDDAKDIAISIYERNKELRRLEFMRDQQLLLKQVAAETKKTNEAIITTPELPEKGSEAPKEESENNSDSVSFTEGEEAPSPKEMKPFPVPQVEKIVGGTAFFFIDQSVSPAREGDIVFGYRVVEVNHKKSYAVIERLGQIHYVPIVW